MKLEDELHEEMISMYQRAGEEVGYWGTRFLQSVRKHGGLATARRMLKPEAAKKTTGLMRLLEAGRPDLTLEHMVLSERFRSLFTELEIREAEKRLGAFHRESKKIDREKLYPDDLELGHKYPEGARKQIRVNSYERDPRARKACLAVHGTACAVCGLSFHNRYGDLGKGFIHVHHVRPMASLGEGYKVDPVKDLIPVCPNCHAMLHRKDPPLSATQLRRRLRSKRGD